MTSIAVSEFDNACEQLTENNVLKKRCMDYLLSLGMNCREVTAVYDSLLFAEQRGKTSHGLNRLFSGFVKNCLDKRLMETNKEPNLLERSDSQQLYFDGNWSVGYYGIKQVVDSVIERSKHSSVVFAHVKNLYPTNVLAEYAEALCQADLVCYITSKSPDKVGPPIDSSRILNHAKPVVGTNAYAWGFPNVGESPVIFDASMAGAVNGDLLKPLAVQRENFEPENYLTHELKRPTDPADLYDSEGNFTGLILPIGGNKRHKGFGNLLIAELFNLLQSDNDTNTSTTIIAMQADTQVLGSLGADFRLKCEAALAYKEGDGMVLPFANDTLESETDILEGHRDAILKLGFEGVINSNIDAPLIPEVLDTEAFKWRLIEQVKQRVLEESDLVPAVAIDEALEADIENSEFFENWGKQYSLPNLDDHRRIMQGLISGVTFSADDEVLDIGCGNGKLIDYLPPIKSLLCLDVSDSMLESILKCQGSVNMHLETVKADFMEFETTAFFDKAVAVMSMHHVLHKDKAKAIEKVSGFLKKDGYFLLGETFLDSEDLNDRNKLVNIADIYCRKILNCFSREVVSHGLKDFQILRRILFANGEYMVSRNRWCKILQNNNFKIVDSRIVTPSISYGYIVAQKI